MQNKLDQASFMLPEKKKKDNKNKVKAKELGEFDAEREN